MNISCGRTGEVRALAARAAEGAFLLGVLARKNLPRLLLRLDEQTAARLRQLRLRSWVCEPEGEAVASHLISLLVNEHLSETGVPSNLFLLLLLQRRCKPTRLTSNVFGFSGTDLGCRV